MLASPSSPPQYLAFDLGASSSRAVLGTLVQGQMRMEELHRFETPILEEGAHLFWDLDALWQELQAGLRAAQEAAGPRLRSLSVDSWAVDYVPLDAGGEPLRNPHCYRDPRTEGVMEEAFETMPAEKIFQRTGIQFLPFNTLYQLLADRRQGLDEKRKAAAYLTVADYFNHRFGGRAVMDASMASTTQLYDVQKGRWAQSLFDAFGLDAEAWPKIVPCGTGIGTVDNEPSKIEVVASCSHDTACAVAAVPAEPDARWAYVSSGTWSLLGTERSAPLLTDDAREAGFTNEVGLDGTIRFLKNLTGFWPLQECVRAWEEADEAFAYEDLFAEAEQAAPAAASLDLQDERFLERGDMEGRIDAHLRERGHAMPETRGALARLLLESLAASYRRTLDALERLTGEEIDVLHLVGGGAQVELLSQLTADATGRRVVAGPVEATALGNLLVQARAMGDLPEDVSVRAAARRSADLRTYTPRRQPA